MLERARLPALMPTCCIFKVPQKMRERKPGAYTPQVVSIGPLHHGNEKLKPMEELKKGYLKSYLGRTNQKVKDCIGKVKEKEGFIRGCYGDSILQSSDDFVKMIVIDACFIIEYFLRFNECSLWDRNNWDQIDPILSQQCQMHDMRLDLVLLENQLLFFLFEDLFFLNPTDGQHSSFLKVSFLYFKELYYTINQESKNDEFTFDYFCKHYLKKRGPTGEIEEVEVQHLTDFIRIFKLPCQEKLLERCVNPGILKYSASQLLEAGLKFKVCQNKSLIELHFDNGVLTMPQLLIDYGTETFLRNMTALEQRHYQSEIYISEYVVLLDFLINDHKDVDILVDNGIINNTLGESEKVVAIFNDICVGMEYPDREGSVSLSKTLNCFYGKPINKYKAIFVRDYLSTPRKIASFIAVIVLLLLALIQTIFSVVSSS